MDKEIAMLIEKSDTIFVRKTRNEIYDEFSQKLLDNLSFITKLFNNLLFPKKLLWFNEKNELRFSSNFTKLLKKNKIQENHNTILNYEIIIKTYQEGISTQDWIKKIISATKEQVEKNLRISYNDHQAIIKCYWKKNIYHTKNVSENPPQKRFTI